MFSGGSRNFQTGGRGPSMVDFFRSGVCFDAPSHILSVFEARVLNKIHNVNIVYWLISKYIECYTVKIYIIPGSAFENLSEIEQNISENEGRIREMEVETEFWKKFSNTFEYFAIFFFLFFILKHFKQNVIILNTTLNNLLKWKSYWNLFGLIEFASDCRNTLIKLSVIKIFDFRKLCICISLLCSFLPSILHLVQWPSLIRHLYSISPDKVNLCLSCVSLRANTL